MHFAGNKAGDDGCTLEAVLAATMGSESASDVYRRFEHLDLAFEHAVIVRAAHHAYDTLNPLGVKQLFGERPK